MVQDVVESRHVLPRSVFEVKLRLKFQLDASFALLEPPRGR